MLHNILHVDLLLAAERNLRQIVVHRKNIVAKSVDSNECLLKLTLRLSTINLLLDLRLKSPYVISAVAKRLQLDMHLFKLINKVSCYLIVVVSIVDP